MDFSHNENEIADIDTVRDNTFVKVLYPIRDATYFIHKGVNRKRVNFYV